LKASIQKKNNQALNLLVVQSLKYTVKEPRPNNGEKNSFPSGHTATTFMGAHFFHKEYAHKSPFYSIAAYTLATMTGVFRLLNGRPTRKMLYVFIS